MYFWYNFVRKWGVSMKKFKIIKLLCLIAYIICIAVLIFESSLDGSASSNQSNAVGGGIANIFNDLSGDKTVTVAPTGVEITNKTDKIFHPGDTYKIEYQEFPENSTYKSYLFTTSDETIATVNHNGLVSFIKAGTVTITIQNENKDYSDILDTISFTILDIEPDSLEISLNAYMNEHDVYELYVGQSYPINSKVLPANASDKSITYTKNDTNNYIELSSNGLITPLKESNGNVITITASTHNNINYTISIEIKIIEIIEIPLEQISTIQNIELIATQSYTPKISFTPADATNKGYTLTSSDSNYVSISGKSIRAIKATENPITITVKSLDNENITTTFTVTVKPQPELESFNASLGTPIYIGATKNITISKITPTYANASNKTFSSSDPSIATVDNNGKVKGVSLGTATITITINGISRSVDVTIIEKPADQTKDFTISTKKTPITVTNNKINLNDYFEATDFKDNDNKPYNPESKTISYTIDPDYGILVGNELTFTSCGIHNIIITHNLSGIEKIVSFTVVDDYELLINDTKYNNEIIKLNVNDSLDLKINNKSSCSHLFSIPSYIVTIDNEDIASINQIGDYYRLTSNSDGILNLKVTPLLDGNPIDKAAITIKIEMNHVLSTSITTNATLNSYLGDEVFIDTSHGAISMFISETLKIDSKPNQGTTLSHISYTVLDKDILTISNDGLITPHKTGITKLIIVDLLSDTRKEITIGVFNYIELASTPITVTGVDAQYDEKNQIFSITNGYSGNIVLHFTEYTTFKEATYTVKDENILTVGSNGVITPLKEGTTTVRIEINDNMHDEAEKIFEVTIRIVRQKAIKDIASFLHKIRKGLGHFGAFLILGIFSTLTYLLYFQNKHWIWSAPLNIAQGFGIAALTEYIQTFRPGRCGCLSDVLLDFSGFMISASIFTLIILIRALIKHIIKKNKMNKA